MAMLLGSGALSLTLAATFSTEATDWIESAAILVSVVIVVGVSATTNWQKEAKFRELNALKDDIKVWGVCEMRSGCSGYRYIDAL